jgi:hypothetical protein
LPIKPLLKSPRSYFIYSFELTPGDPLPAMKIYFSMWCFASLDADLRRRLDSFFVLKWLRGLLNSYEKGFGDGFVSHYSSFHAHRRGCGRKMHRGTGSSSPLNVVPSQRIEPRLYRFLVVSPES